MITILTYIIIFIIITRVTTRLVFGPLLTDKHYLKMVIKNKNIKVELDQLNFKIIYFGNLSYITTVPFDIFSKYYISNLGTVPRWSKMHQIIEEERKKAIETL